MMWVVNYNAVDCHIYAYEKDSARLSLVKEIKDPRNRSHKDPKEVEVDHFAREVAQLLEEGRNDHAYEGLYVIGPPHMNGLLFKHISKYVKEMVKLEIQKDYQNITPKDLLGYIQKEEKISIEKTDQEDLEKIKGKAVD
jgi:protein required for attachment to host cells